jgi:glycerophosphoryl diester phosphodiesterase
MCKRKHTINLGVLIIFIIGGVILYNFARKAEPVNNTEAEWLTNAVIAHRGVHNGDVPENTIRAFGLAVEKGYAIELDVSMTKDKKLVIFHDKKLERLLGDPSLLKDMDYAKLISLKFPGSDEKVPLLSEVLTFIAGKVPLLIEIKNEGEIGPLESQVYSALKAYKGKYAVQSFNPHTIGWFKKNAPHILRGQLSGSFEVSDEEVEKAGTSKLPWYKKVLLSNLLLNFVSRPNFIAYEVNNMDINTVKRIKELGVPVLGWTVRDAAVYQKFKGECDNFITEVFDFEV